MDFFWLNAAYWYFGAMVVIGVFQITVHTACVYMLNAYSATQPDDSLRQSEKYMHGAMAAVALTSILFMLLLLDQMVTICATYPLPGAFAHIPLIGSMAAMGAVAVSHFRRQLRKVKGL